MLTKGEDGINIYATPLCELRFVKWDDGTRILQQRWIIKEGKGPARWEWRTVPMVLAGDARDE